MAIIDANGNIVETISPARGKIYIKALIAFLQKKDFNYQKLDSALTLPTSELVADIISKCIEKDVDKIAEIVFPIILSDNKFSEKLAAAIFDACSAEIPKFAFEKTKEIVTSKIVASLSASVSSTSMVTIKSSTVQIVGASISSPIAAKISIIVTKSMIISLKPIIIKVLASAAFKTAIMAKIKSIVVGAILGSLIKIIAAKLGLGPLGAAMFVLVPLIVAWIAYEINSLPSKLARKVSESIADDLASNYKETTHEISKNIIESTIANIASNSIEEIVNNIINDDSIVEVVNEIISYK